MSAFAMGVALTKTIGPSVCEACHKANAAKYGTDRKGFNAARKRRSCQAWKTSKEALYTASPEAQSGS